MLNFPSHWFMAIHHSSLNSSNHVCPIIVAGALVILHCGRGSCCINGSILEVLPSCSHHENMSSLESISPFRLLGFGYFKLKLQYRYRCLGQCITPSRWNVDENVWKGPILQYWWKLIRSTLVSYQSSPNQFTFCIILLTHKLPNGHNLLGSGKNRFELFNLLTCFESVSLNLWDIYISKPHPTINLILIFSPENYAYNYIPISQLVLCGLMWVPQL